MNLPVIMSFDAGSEWWYVASLAFPIGITAAICVWLAFAGVASARSHAARLDEGMKAVLGPETRFYDICGGCGRRVPARGACQVCQKWPLSGVSE